MTCTLQRQVLPSVIPAGLETGFNIEKLETEANRRGEPKLFFPFCLSQRP